MRIVVAALALAALACTRPPTTAPLDFGTGGSQRFAGLAACSAEQPTVQSIDPDQPVVVLVHGCYASGGRFRALADVFALHGQQVLCFNYDYRDSLRTSADQLRAALAGLRERMGDDRVTVIGHSQGGLVARAAFSSRSDPGRAPAAAASDAPYRLVTVSSPFAGIEMASDCGKTLLHVATLGITVAVCQIATGSNWREIHPRSAMVRDPAPLSPSVADHLSVMTDERESCRRLGRDGKCDESDFVFSLDEQSNPLVLDDPRVRSERIEAGHVEIVGDQGRRPDKLVGALQRHGILAPTPPEQRQALARLLARLYRAPSP